MDIELEVLQEEIVILKVLYSNGFLRATNR